MAAAGIDVYSIFELLFSVSGYAIPLIIIAMIGIVGWYKRWFVKMPINVMEFQTFQGSLRINKMKARALRKKGEQGGKNYLEFRNKKRWEIPSFDDMYLDKKGKAWLFIETNVAGDHNTIKKEDVGSDVVLRAKANASIDFWKETESAKADLRWTKKDMIDKLYPIIALVMISVMVILLIFGTMNYGIFPLLDRGEAYLARTEEAMALSTQILDKAVQFMSLLNTTGLVNLTVPLNPVPTGNVSG